MNCMGVNDRQCKASELKLCYDVDIGKIFYDGSRDCVHKKGVFTHLHDNDILKLLTFIYVLYSIDSKYHVLLIFIYFAGLHRNFTKGGDSIRTSKYYFI